MTIVQQMASFIQKAEFSELSDDARNQIKIRILDSLGVAIGVDSLGVAIGAVDGEPIKMIRTHIRDFGHSGRCTMLGGGETAPDFAALYNSALVRI
jgi:2-methylcitrate dehydratase